VPKSDKKPSFDLTIQYRERTEDVSEEEFRLIAAHLPELLKLMMEELSERRNRR